MKWRPPKKDGPSCINRCHSQISSSAVVAPCFHGVPFQGHHLVVVHLEQYTTDKLSRCDRSSIDCWFLAEGKLAGGRQTFGILIPEVFELSQFSLLLCTPFFRVSPHHDFLVSHLVFRLLFSLSLSSFSSFFSSPLLFSFLRFSFLLSSFLLYLLFSLCLLSLSLSVSVCW